jgi:hypothetical protein
MRTLLSLFFISALVFSCGDAGLQLNVSKSVPFIFEIEGDDLEFDANGVASYTSEIEIDLATGELADFIDAIDFIVINEIAMQFDEFDGDATFDLSLAADNGIGDINDVSGPIVNGQSISIHPGGDQAAMDRMSTTISNGNDFLLTVSTTFDGDVDLSGFKLTYTFDVTGKIRE